MSTKQLQAKHKTLIPFEELGPIWGIDVSEHALKKWAQCGTRFLAGKKLRYKVKDIPMLGNGSGRFRTIEWWGKHIREISKNMKRERAAFRKRYPNVDFYGSVEALPAKYKRDGTGAPIFTPDLKDYGFAIKSDGSVVSAQYWRDNSCDHLGGRRFDAALLYVALGDGWRCDQWRWVWSEPDAKQIGAALKIKEQTTQQLIQEGKVISDEESIPRECRENQNPDGAPWFTDRVVEYLKLEQHFGKHDPRFLLYPWRVRCRYMPKRAGLKCLQMKNGQLVWYDEQIQFLHNRFAKLPPKGRMYDENDLPAKHREGGRIDGAPLRIRVIEKLAGRKFSFRWIHSCPFKYERQGLDYIYLKPAGEMVFLWEDVCAIMRGEVHPPAEIKSVPEHEVPDKYRDDDGTPLSVAPLDRAYTLGKPYGLPATQKTRLKELREECEHCPEGYLRAIAYHDALHDRVVWAHHRDDCTAIKCTLRPPPMPTKDLSDDYHDDKGRPLGHAELVDAARRGQPFGMDVSEGLLSEWRDKCDDSPTGKLDAIWHGEGRRASFAHNRHIAKAIVKARTKPPQQAVDGGSGGRSTPETSECIEYIGPLTYRAGVHVKVVTAREDELFQAFLENQFMDSIMLANRLGHDSGPVIFSQLRRKYSCFGVHMKPPGGKARGGYHIKIRRDCPITTQ